MRARCGRGAGAVRGAAARPPAAGALCGAEHSLAAPRPPVQFKINPTGAVFAELMCPADTDSGGEPPASVEKDYFKCHN